ncbi:hypothetical protein [Streptomyces sp. NPDC051546]|uniref:hypothetical protein n=1 Tax=Streptomyces sp. NPDC051546 TaxID=3365655 RepID=UPI00378B6E1C
MWKTATKSTLPDQLRLTDPSLRGQLEALPASQVLIGLGAEGQPVRVDLDAESPHVLILSAAGGGTSTILRTLTAQLLHHGGHALVLDIKRISQRWARGLPAVTYRSNIADIHDALVGLGDEMKRRLDHVDQHGDTAGLTRLTLVFESADRTLRELARHWDKVQEEGAPKTSPAVDAYEELLFAGRAARIHVLAGAQSHSTALGREQFSTVILGRVTTRGWSRLAPQIYPAPKSSPHPGRAHVVQGPTPTRRRPCA